MTIHLSARSRLTLFYTSLFAIGGGTLITVTYLLVAHSLHNASPAVTPDVRLTIARCIQAVQAKADPSALQKCGAVYLNGVQAGAAAQRSTTLTHLLAYSLLGLAALTLLSLAAGRAIAGRILRPVRRITAAARDASEQNLAQRIALQGPRDELRELADTFDTMLERLDATFTSQRQFIANASHELRTPLTVMRTTIDVVLAKPRPTPEELATMATEVRHAVDDAERLIEALLILARNERGRLPHDPLDLATIVEDVLDQRRPTELALTSALADAPVTGDAVLLERLIGNLLDNAERYNTDGGTISIETSADAACSTLRVVNTGDIIPAQQLDRLFIPFTRLNDRTRHEGFGLGLALVSSIATVHRGTIDAVAPPLGGLDISARLPRRRSSAHGEPEPKSEL